MSLWRYQPHSMVLPSLKNEKTANTLTNLGNVTDSTPKKSNMREIKSETFINRSYKDVGESRMRNEKINAMISDYINSKEYRDFEDYFVTGTGFTPYAPASKSIYQNFEKILAIYKIDVYAIWNDMEDSAVSVSPIPKEHDMHVLAGILLKVLRQFPYSFYRAIDLRILTFCGDVKLMKPNYSQIFIRKYYNWFFMVNEHKTLEQVQRHLYHTICYNLVAKHSDLNEKWEKLNPPKTPKNSTKVIGGPKAGFLNSKCTKNSTIDQFEVFEALMNNPKEVIFHPDQIVAKKARMLMDALCFLDPEGINDSWWTARGLVANGDDSDDIFNEN